ncbi:phage major capsid protein [Aestuariivirga sp.]|uniref:phage major capsid protein n=1 Tax=Aestuariivirga sp. TaxID=2650926 RepID=UPI0039E549EF
MDFPTPLETKVAAAATHDDVLVAFEAFKEANDERLAQIEKRMSADVVTAEKVERISRAIDELSLKAKRPSLSGETKAEPSEHRRAFDGYVRKGETHGLFEIEQKSMSVASAPDGGYLVPVETEAEISRILAKTSPMRQIADVRQVSAAVYKKPFATAGAAAGWVGETAARPETASATLAELQFPAMELYAMPAATQTLLDDSAVNLDHWIAQEVETVFAEQESEAFVTGNGVNKPKGFMDYTKVANATWAWGAMGYVATGTAGAFPASNPSDKLVDMIYAVKAGYRQNGTWIMNRATQSLIRKFKDAAGNYLWQPAATADGNATLLNFRIVESEHMPDVAADSHALAFGDFKRGYLIVDRVGVRMLRDPYSSKPYVLFYTTKRVGGGIQNFEAIKTLKFGVS